jgi:ParB-like chromosome segregation protein Spo0J
MSDSIPLSSIDFTANRDMGDLSGLQDSLRRLGTIHPPALSKYTAPDGSTRYKPVAGRRRLHALRANGVTELFHNSILDPERPGFAFKDEVPEDELQEATLDENLYRLKPKWQEDCLLVADVHELKRKKHGTNEWGVRQTASLLGEGYGKSNVSLALNVAKLLRAKDPEILAAENLMEANTIRIKRQEDKALAELQKRVQLPKTEAKPTGPVDVSSFLDSFSVSTQGGDSTEPNNRPSGVAVLPGANVPSVAPGIQNGPLVSAPPVSVPLSKMFFNMDFRKAYRLNLQVNHIVTDIPYGIDMKNLNASVKLDSVLDEHEVGANIDLMYPFLKFAYDTLLPHGFCVFFYDLDHHEKLQTWAKEFGFKVQRWPLNTTLQNHSKSLWYFAKMSTPCCVTIRLSPSTTRPMRPTTSRRNGRCTTTPLLNLSPCGKTSMTSSRSQARACSIRSAVKCPRVVRLRTAGSSPTVSK